MLRSLYVFILFKGVVSTSRCMDLLPVRAPRALSDRFRWCLGSMAYFDFVDNEGSVPSRGNYACFFPHFFLVKALAESFGMQVKAARWNNRLTWVCRGRMCVAFGFAREGCSIVRDRCEWCLSSIRCFDFEDKEGSVSQGFFLRAAFFRSGAFRGTSSSLAWSSFLFRLVTN